MEELRVAAPKRKIGDGRGDRRTPLLGGEGDGPRGKYNYHIVNDNLKTAYDVLRSILIAEEHKNR